MPNAVPHDAALSSAKRTTKALVKPGKGFSKFARVPKFSVASANVPAPTNAPDGLTAKRVQG